MINTKGYSPFKTNGIHLFIYILMFNAGKKQELKNLFLSSILPLRRNAVSGMSKIFIYFEIMTLKVNASR